MNRYLIAILTLLALTFQAGTATGASVRLKDIVEFEIRSNPLVGYGLVVGLQGTGDTLGNSPFTQQSLEAMLERLGVNTRDQNINTENVAAVMVTADLPAFGRQGSQIDVVVNSLGDAESLLGGTLLVTPLVGADGEVYAVAQGPIIVGGFSATGNAQTITKNIPTVGRISNGATIERETGFELSRMQQMRLSLRNPDLTTALRVEKAINKRVGQRISKAMIRQPLCLPFRSRTARKWSPCWRRSNRCRSKPIRLPGSSSARKAGVDRHGSRCAG